MPVSRVTEEWIAGILAFSEIQLQMLGPNYEETEKIVDYLHSRLLDDESEVTAAKLVFFHQLMDEHDRRERAELREAEERFTRDGGSNGFDVYVEDLDDLDDEDDLPWVGSPDDGYDWDDTIGDSDEGAPL